MRRQFLRFLVTGGIAAAVNLACRYALNRYMSFEIAVALAYLIGMTTAYALARRFVFSASDRSVASEFRRFTLVNAVSLVLVWLVSVGLARFVFPAIGFAWHAEDISHLIGVAVPAITSFFGHRLYTFERHVAHDRRP
jgi:putative flippase GtrA